MGVEPKIGGFDPPKWMVKIMGNPYEQMDDLGGKILLFFGNTLIWTAGGGGDFIHIFWHVHHELLGGRWFAILRVAYVSKKWVGRFDHQPLVITDDEAICWDSGQ